MCLLLLLIAALPLLLLTVLGLLLFAALCLLLLLIAALPLLLLTVLRLLLFAALCLLLLLIAAFRLLLLIALCLFLIAALLRIHLWIRFLLLHLPLHRFHVFLNRLHLLLYVLQFFQFLFAFFNLSLRLAFRLLDALLGRLHVRIRHLLLFGRRVEIAFAHLLAGLSGVLGRLLQFFSSGGGGFGLVCETFRFVGLSSRHLAHCRRRRSFAHVLHLFRQLLAVLKTRLQLLLCLIQTTHLLIVRSRPRRLVPHCGLVRRVSHPFRCRLLFFTGDAAIASGCHFVGSLLGMFLGLTQCLRWFGIRRFIRHDLRKSLCTRRQFLLIGLQLLAFWRFGLELLLSGEFLSVVLDLLPATGLAAIVSGRHVDRRFRSQLFEPSLRSGNLVRGSLLAALSRFAVPRKEVLRRFRRLAHRAVERVGSVRVERTDVFGSLLQGPCCCVLLWSGSLVVRVSPLRRFFLKLRLLLAEPVHRHRKRIRFCSTVAVADFELCGLLQHSSTGVVFRFEGSQQLSSFKMVACVLYAFEDAESLGHFQCILHRFRTLWAFRHLRELRGQVRIRSAHTLLLLRQITAGLGRNGIHRRQLLQTDDPSLAEQFLLLLQNLLQLILAAFQGRKWCGTID